MKCFQANRSKSYLTLAGKVGMSPNVKQNGVMVVDDMGMVSVSARAAKQRGNRAEEGWYDHATAAAATLAGGDIKEVGRGGGKVVGLVAQQRRKEEGGYVLAGGTGLIGAMR